MKRIGMFASALLLGTMLAGAAQAKTLVYCSEGSPENFTPAMNTTGTSFDAARPVYNQLVRVRARLDQGRSRPRRELGSLATMA